MRVIQKLVPLMNTVKSELFSDVKSRKRLSGKCFNFLDPLITSLGCKSTAKSLELKLVARLCIDIPSVKFCSLALNENPVENENILKV